MSKIAIVGSGFVGSTTAFTIATSSLANEIVLIDIHKNKAEGDALDISHGMPLTKPVDLYAGDYADAKGADVIVITAGVNRTPGSSRLELVKDNVEIFKKIIPELVKVNKEAIYLIVSNPVDILTYVTQKISGLPETQIIGSGTVLDSSRFRYLLSKEIEIDPRNIHGYIIGEHGDSELAAWSVANVSGMPIDEYCALFSKPMTSEIKDDIENAVRKSGFEIIRKKGATYYAVALAVKRIVESIIRDEKSILSVSTLIKGQYGVEDVALSLPSVVGANGVERILELPLDEKELKAFKNSADIMKKIISDVGF